MASEAKIQAAKGERLKILTPKEMLQRLSISLAQVKAGSNSESLLNEIRQIVFYLFVSIKKKKKKLKKYMIAKLNKYNYKNGYYIY